MNYVGLDIGSKFPVMARNGVNRFEIYQMKSIIGEKDMQELFKDMPFYDKLVRLLKIMMKKDVLPQSNTCLVIGVPSYFNIDSERNTCLHAALKNLRIKRSVELMNEGTAIALYYAFKNHWDSLNGKNIIFLYVGDSQTQVTIVRFTEKKLKVLHESNGDNSFTYFSNTSEHKITILCQNALKKTDMKEDQVHNIILLCDDYCDAIVNFLSRYFNNRDIVIHLEDNNDKHVVANGLAHGGWIFANPNYGYTV